jgi:hypothetical protein
MGREKINNFIIKFLLILKLLLLGQKNNKAAIRCYAKGGFEA